MTPINTDQVIFDAISAAVTPVRGFDATHTELFIDVKKFIETFNNHRDRKLCTSLDVAQAVPEPRCERCNGTGWLDAIGPKSDGSYITSRRCLRGDGRDLDYEKQLVVQNKPFTRRFGP